MILNSVSAHRIRSIINRFSSGIPHAFNMDHNGVIIGETNLTIDLWQGDKNKFLHSYVSGVGGVYVSAIEMDMSTGMMIQEVSLPVIDDSTSQVVGVITWGIRETSVPCLNSISIKSLYDGVLNPIDHHGLSPNDESFIATQLIPMSWDPVFVDMIIHSPHSSDVVITQMNAQWQSDNVNFTDYTLSPLQNATIGNSVAQYIRNFIGKETDRTMSEAFLVGIQGQTLAASGRLVNYLHENNWNECLGDIHVYDRFSMR